MDRFVTPAAVRVERWGNSVSVKLTTSGLPIGWDSTYSQAMRVRFIGPRALADGRQATTAVDDNRRCGMRNGYYYAVTAVGATAAATYELPIVD